MLNVSGTGVIISGLTLTGGNSGSFGGGLWVTGTGEAQASDLIIFSNNAVDGGGVANGGTLVLSDSTVSNNISTGSSFGAGGIYNSGMLTLNNVTVNNNSTNLSGGGIYNHSAGTLSISDITVSNNTAGTDGGGIYTEGHIELFDRAEINNNTATSSGGGIYSGPNIVLVESSVSGNSAGSFGGGINGVAQVQLVSSIVSDNSAATAGGGVFANSVYPGDSTLSGNSSDFGGAFYLGGSGVATVHNSTITNNTATTEGGGIWSAGSVIFIDSIISNNTASNCQGPGSESWHSSGYNIDSEDTCGFNAEGDQVNTDPLLGPLQDNGGYTMTHALLPGSPAIDAGNDATCTGVDQRGIYRPVDGDNDGVATCDVGAYEVGSFPDLGDDVRSNGGGSLNWISLLVLIAIIVARRRVQS